MLLHDLVQTSAEVAATRSRKRKVERLAELCARLAGADLEIGVPYLAGELRQGKVGIGWALVRDARPAASASEPCLTLADVDRTFTAIGAIAGKGAKARRVDALRALFERATADEHAFLAKLCVGELRQGALEAVLLEAVAAATELDPADVRRAAMLGGSLADVALAVLTDGAAGLARFRLELFRPLQPMLAQPAGGAGEVFAKLGPAASEWKLDGARLQVHKRGDEVRAYTRKRFDVTRSVPEVVELVRALPTASLILDGEVIALAPDGRPHPFQVTMGRFGRKLDVDAERRKLPLSAFFFDLLLADCVEWLDRPNAERWAELERIVPAEHRVVRADVTNEDELEASFASALDAGHEGVVVKALDAGYAAGRRGSHWLKLKPAHTLDLVVLAAEWGSGRREGWLSNLHLGARDPANGDFVMLGKTFKGMTDATLERQTRELLALETGRAGHVVRVRPEKVVEIAFDGVQRSPHYPGGLALRFARLKRYRDDKSADDADTIEAVRGLEPGANVEAE